MEEVRTDEVKYALKQMKNGTAPGPDDMIVDVLKCGAQKRRTLDDSCPIRAT